MSKKIELTPEQISLCIKMYVGDLLGSTTISEKMGINKTIIIRTLKENGIIISPSGRRNIGGKSASDKRNYHKHKLKKSEYHKEWREDKKEHLKEYHAEWRENNRESINEKSRLWSSNKRQNDSSFKLKCNTRTALWTCLKERNVAKYRSTFELLEYSLEELIIHLEKKFTEGMSWENYGEWHVDHKIPMSKFNFTTTEDIEFKLCWSLDNLQPLWELENLSKGNRIKG